LIGKFLEATARLTNTQAAAVIDAHDSYLSKLRKGWRPKQLRPSTVARMRGYLSGQADPTPPRAGTAPAGFAEGYRWGYVRAARDLLNRALDDALDIPTGSSAPDQVERERHAADAAEAALQEREAGAAQTPKRSRRA